MLDTTVDGRNAPNRRRVLAWALFLAAAAYAAVGSFLLIMRLVEGSMTVSGVMGQFVLVPPAAGFSIVGLVVALRQPANPCGWLMLVIGFFWSLGVSPQPDGEPAFDAINSAGWVLPFGLMATHLPLRLPDGHLPSPRWRWVSRLATLAMVIVIVGIGVSEGVSAETSWADVMGTTGIVLLAVTAIASIASLVVRSRRADSIERHQIRWIAIGGATFISAWLVTILVSLSLGAEEPELLLSAIALTFYAAIPVSIGIAILKYRLYDIDVVIRKALIVATLAAFFAVVYALIVGGVGALVESSGNTALSFASAVIAAVLFQPVLSRARRFADRFVYGKRATPYEVLAEFGEHLAGTYAADDVVPRTARMLGEGIGAERATVWLVVGDELRPVATWPPDADPGTGDEHRAEVRHQGELLGALSVAMPANDPMDPSKERLIADVAAQAGLVLRNVALVEDLRASRRRLVSAQDEERRKLERNIHDGAQQQLVALAVKTRLARQLTERDSAKAAALLQEVEGEAARALEDLRALARGIYPPLLADKGLAAALRSQADRSVVPVDVATDGIARYPQAVEAAVYFSVLEALQNVSKYAGASRAAVRLRHEEGLLVFEVHDDGDGFDPAATSYGTGLQGMADRLAALDGRIRVDSSPGSGTTVTGSIPLSG